MGKAFSKGEKGFLKRGKPGKLAPLGKALRRPQIWGLISSLENTPLRGALKKKTPRGFGRPEQKTSKREVCVEPQTKYLEEPTA